MADTSEDRATKAREAWIRELCDLGERELIEQFEAVFSEIASVFEQGDERACAKITAAAAAFKRAQPAGSSRATEGPADE